MCAPPAAVLFAIRGRTIGRSGIAGHTSSDVVGVVADGEARRIAALFATQAGFEAVIAGPFARAKDFDRGTPVWVTGTNTAQVREALGLQPSR
jgi:predicted dinucleotide-binding enzyme